jgi:hypothetical protein
MAITKPKISSLVSSQLPAFIQEDYTTFVAFLEAYYEYLETETILDFDEISNIDTTLDSFVKYFKNELALNFPTTLIEDRFLLPKLKELYISKGSEASYKLLFKILYNKDIEVKYPATQMLRVSDGKWIQPVSVFASINIGTPDSIVGRTVNIVSTDQTNQKKISVFIDSYKESTTVGVYEFSILSGFTGTFNIGDLLNYSDIFTGVIVATTTTLSIVQGGRNFKVGQTYDVIGSGTGSVIKVESVDGFGAIKIAKFINFGVGYPTAFTTNILALTNQISEIQNFFTVGGSSPAYNANIIDSVNQITDEGLLSVYNYASTLGSGLYVDSSYAGSIVRSFANAASTSIVDPLDYAIFSIQLGSLAKYPGYYKNNDGFLDDTIYIQDSKYFQAFSYAIQIDELFDSYKSIVKNLIHPSGSEIFGEYNIDIAFDTDITIDILSLYSNLVDESSNQLITESGDSLIAIV